ncbi:MAG: NAD-dependent epimerase/dehydratase family protein [Candidatus Tectimicrobiota bacterium]
MRVLVIGATGFVGQHVVSTLLAQGHTVTAVARNIARARQFPWFDQVRFLACDIYQLPANPAKVFGPAEAVIHLTWPGLPNYQELFHFEDNLPADYAFLKALVHAGYDHLLVTGTCLEYGLQSGCLSEEMLCQPTTAYGLAKDTLRKFLTKLQETMPFFLQWVRLFYMYGQGQNPRSLLAQLDAALQQGETHFNMSGGEQLRDYLAVEDVARTLVSLAVMRKCSGIFNCCSGQPISVRRLVEQRLEQQGKTITLRLGYYPYPEYEPLAFWGSRQKLDALRIGYELEPAYRQERIVSPPPIRG